MLQLPHQRQTQSIPTLRYHLLLYHIVCSNKLWEVASQVLSTLCNMKKIVTLYWATEQRKKAITIMKNVQSKKSISISTTASFFFKIKNTRKVSVKWRMKFEHHIQNKTQSEITNHVQTPIRYQTGGTLDNSNIPCITDTSLWLT